MPVFNEGPNIVQTRDSDIVWSTSRRPVLLLKDNKITVPNFQIAFPDFAKSNGYGFAAGDVQTSCISFVTINPQEWQSAPTAVATLPADCNYFETEITLSRTKAPSGFRGFAIPDTWASGSTHMPDGNAAVLELINPIVRMFRLERTGNVVNLIRKQSVRNGGNRFAWNNPNDNNTGAGGMRSGWTYAGDPRGWLASQIDLRAGGNINKRRGEQNGCSTGDNTDYSSIWSGTLIITPGFIKI